MIDLKAGALSLGLVPEIGGGVAYFRSGALDLMRPLSDAARARGDVLGVAMFPMVPYANRIADNRFAFRGHEWRFAANNPPERFNVHGTGWRLPWSVEDAGIGEASLVLDHRAPEEPYSYHARQRFALTPDRLVVTTSVENRGLSPMPFGLGQHPWFSRQPGVSIRFRARQFWLEGPDGVATDAIDIPPQLDFSRGRPLPATWRNNDYGGWDGAAEIAFAAHGIGLRIVADPILGHLMLYADPTKPVFCLEPQSHAPCAFNRIGRSEAGEPEARVLDPGATLEATVAFVPFAL